MKSYSMQLSDGSKVHFECEPAELNRWVADLTRIYAKRGLRVLQVPKELLK